MRFKTFFQAFHDVHTFAPLVTAVPSHRPAAVQGFSAFFAAPFRHVGRLLLLLLRRVSGRERCLAEVVSNFSCFLFARPTFTPSFRWDFLGDFVQAFPLGIPIFAPL